jgi:hypothetical protein
VEGHDGQGKRRCACLYCSILGFLKQGHQSDVVQLFGSALLLVKVITHVAGHFYFLIAMRCGSPDSSGPLSRFGQRIW